MLTIDRRVVAASFEDNPHVDATAVRRAFADLPEARRSHLLLGDWSADDVPSPSSSSPREESTAFRDDDTEAGPPRLRALIGQAAGREVWFDPYRPSRPLANCHVFINGETGSGKTQTVMALVADLRAGGVVPLLLDRKDDYVGEWAQDQHLPVIAPLLGTRLPFNPLAPVADPRTQIANPLHQIHRAVDIVKRVWHLGDQQAYRLREAAKEAFQRSGIPLAPAPLGPMTRYPTLVEAAALLEPSDTLRGRLSPLLDLDPFADHGCGLGALLERGAVVRLAGLPGEEARTATAEFLLLAIYDFVLAQSHARGLRWVLGIDEARHLAQSPYLEPLLREGRAYGLGVLIASQFPRDLSLEVKGCAATQLYGSQSQLEQIAEIQRAVLGETRGADARRLAGAIRGLQPFEAVLHTRGKWGVVRVTPDFQRRPP
ncbi:MAG: ATP-binding protein [Candidatus Dormibacteraceae bacterium]